MDNSERDQKFERLTLNSTLQNENLILNENNNIYKEKNFSLKLFTILILPIFMTLIIIFIPYYPELNIETNKYTISFPSFMIMQYFYVFVGNFLCIRLMALGMSNSYLNIYLWSIIVDIFISLLNIFLFYFIKRFLYEFSTFIWIYYDSLFLPVLLIFNYLRCLKVTPKNNPQLSISYGENRFGNKPYKSDNKTKHDVWILLSLTFIMDIQFLFCGYFQGFFISDWFKNISYLRYLFWFLFWLGLLIFKKFMAYLLKYCNTSIDSALCYIIIGGHLTYNITYRAMFVKDEEFSYFEIFLLFLEYFLIELIQFYIPLTNSFKNMRKKDNFVGKTLRLFYEESDEYINYKVTSEYFLRLLGVVWSLVTPLLEIIIVEFSYNKVLFQSFFEFNSQKLIRYGSLLFLEMIIFICIHSLSTRYSNVSGLYQYSFCFKKLDNLIMCIFWSAALMQDIIFSIITTYEYRS